ncbi:MAG: sensor histidine kinase [Candidatus Glassbacteria bacterium]|nr:sensor histidine kinase [Candidatus Glassbacteria bacterium]
MTDYLTAYGTISQQLQEAIDFVAVARAKVKGKCFGPSRALQEEVRKLYNTEVQERLQVIGRLIIELGKARPKRFAVGLSRLTLNLGDSAERMLNLLYLPGYRNLLKVAVAQLDHIGRSLTYFQRIILNKKDSSVFNVNSLMRDIILAACPYCADFMPPGHEDAVRVSFRDKLDEGVPHMEGYPEGIYLALFQMVSNAVAAAGDGGQVSVYTSYYPKFKQLQVTIADNGKGIDRLGILKSALLSETVSMEEANNLRADKSDHNNKLFALIYYPRVSAFGLEDENHKGIGLVLAREEILGHGGKIEVHSKAGRGTSFQVFFTLK